MFHVKQPPLDRAGFCERTGIEVATADRLAAVLELLRRWQRRINLVGASTLDDPWRRHILDSAQLAPLLPRGDPRVADLGTGAGFPGLVLAIVADCRMVLVDSDARKCAFVREAARISGADVEVMNARMETLPPAIADAVVARACAPLMTLLPVAARCLCPGGIALFLKGRTLDVELTAARKEWTLSTRRIDSVTDADGAVLIVETMVPRDDQ